jgi:hypothetical protein
MRGIKQSGQKTTSKKTKTNHPFDVTEFSTKSLPHLGHSDDCVATVCPLFLKR